MRRFQLSRFFFVSAKISICLSLAFGVLSIKGLADSPQSFPNWQGGPAETWKNKAVAVGRDGHIVVVGTASGDFRTGDGPNPTPAGGSDVFVALLDPAGDLQKLTYIGGSGDESALDVAIAPDGLVAVSGRTDSTDFPTIDGSNGDSFISVVDFATKELVWSSRFTGKLANVGFAATNTLFFAYAESDVTSKVGRLPFTLRQPGIVEQIRVEGEATALFVGRSQFCVGVLSGGKSLLSAWPIGRPLAAPATKTIEIPVVARFGGWDAKAGVFWAAGKIITGSEANNPEQARQYVPLEGDNGDGSVPIPPPIIPKEVTQSTLTVIPMDMKVTAFTITPFGPVAAGVNRFGSTTFWNLGLNGLARTAPVTEDHPEALATMLDGNLIYSSPRSVRVFQF